MQAISSKSQQQVKIDNLSKDKNDYYNLPLASFTFGRDSEKKLFQFTLKEEKEKDPNTDILKEKDHSDINLPINIENKPRHSTQKVISTFINKIGSHNSFLSVILHSIYYLKSLRYFFLNDLCELREKDQKSKLLYTLRNILIKYTENKKIDLSPLRITLAELFQNRRKFLIDHPDDPCDCYFIFVNAIHSFFMQALPNEVFDGSCREKCFAHKYLWLDLEIIDECGCGKSGKKLCSNFNFIFDIPIDQIFEMTKNTVIIPNSSASSNGYKVKEQHLSQIPYSMNEFQGKLFYYYRALVNQAKVNCPVNGIRCNVNQGHKKIVIKSSPMYLVFSLQQTKNFVGASWTVSEHLRSFILISHKINLNQVCEVHQKNGNNKNQIFEFLGCIMIKNSKVYTCVFKTTNSWIYYDDETVISFRSWFEFLSYILKSGDAPFMLFYQKDDDKPKDESLVQITQEQILVLERYAINADNLPKIYQSNKIRITEEVIPLQTILVQTQEKKEKLCTNGNEYMCYNCHYKNNIDNKNCCRCNTDNSEIINQKFNIRCTDYRTAEVSSKRSEMQINYSENDKNKNPFNQQNKEKKSKQNSEICKEPTVISLSTKGLIYPKNIEKGVRYQVTRVKPRTVTRKSHKFQRQQQAINENLQSKEIHQRPQTANHLSSKEILTKDQEQKNQIKKTKKDYGRQKNCITSQTSQGKNFRLPHQSPELWKCPRCNNTNKDYDNLCQACRYSKRGEMGYARLHTPKGNRVMEKKNINNTFENKCMSTKGESQYKDSRHFASKK